MAQVRQVVLRYCFIPICFHRGFFPSSCCYYSLFPASKEFPLLTRFGLVSPKVILLGLFLIKLNFLCWKGVRTSLMLRLRLIENCCGETIAEAGLDPKPLTILGSRLGGSEKTKGDADYSIADSEEIKV
uniref:Uncharacterized protein n=1 Tax=Vicia faba TaxID=3906 RepID=R4IV19_VICFA|nr:hypothetical protein [Vicia faba]AGC79001.1 hypothetical protein [Vicia faba]